MAAPQSPLVYAQAVSRNLIPLAGILFLGWSAANVLILYFVDTLLAMTVMFAGLLRHFLPPPTDDGWAARANAEVGYVGTALFIVAFISVPLGIPLVFMLAGSGLSWRTLVADPTFRSGIVLQAIAAFWSGLDLYRALATRTPDELRIKRRFALVFLRWIVVVMVSYLGIGFFLGRYAALFFVAIYTVATIIIDVAPERFLRAMPGGAEDADPPPAPPRRERSRKRR